MRRERAHVAHHFMTMLLVLSLAAASFSACSAHAAEPTVGKWIDIFNGKDLDGWTPKITGHALDENYADTFQVRDGLLTVSYDKYEKFDNKFGHLFYQHAFSLPHPPQYRFTASRPSAAPAGFRNSGIRVHCQDPATMTKDQNFLFRSRSNSSAATAVTNAPPAPCTPGTRRQEWQARYQFHCINSTSDTFHGDQWVTAESKSAAAKSSDISSTARLFLNTPARSLTRAMAMPRAADNAGTMLSKGWISLQAESHPVQFRNIKSCF